MAQIADIAGSVFRGFFPSEPRREGDVESGEPNEPLLARSKHRVALLFHIGFKIAAFLLYLIGGLLLTSSFVTLFVIVVLILAFDFWTVKNVTGRLLVGMRWSNEVKEDGTNEWRFESIEDRTQIADVDSKFFWLSLWAAGIVWGFAAISSFLALRWGWLLLCCVAVALTASNLMGYIKCSRAAQAQIKGIATRVATESLVSSITSAISGRH